MSEPRPQVQRTEQRQCKQHGEYKATVTKHDIGGCFSDYVSRCPRCISEESARVNELDKQKRRRAIERLRSKSGVPARFAAADFSSYLVSNESMQVAHRVLGHFASQWGAQAASGQSLLLVGGPGTGKTHLACAVVNALALDLTLAQYGTVAELIGRIKRNYGLRGSDDSDRELIRLQTVPLLVIDELDVGLSEHDLGLIFRLIDDRYANLRPMVLISNRPAAELERVLGQRVMDRLSECAVTVAFNWPSHRRPYLKDSGRSA